VLPEPHTARCEFVARCQPCRLFCQPAHLVKSQVGEQGDSLDCQRRDNVSPIKRAYGKSRNRAAKVWLPFAMDRRAAGVVTRSRRRQVTHVRAKFVISLLSSPAMDHLARGVIGSSELTLELRSRSSESFVMLLELIGCCNRYRTRSAFHRNGRFSVVGIRVKMRRSECPLSAPHSPLDAVRVVSEFLIRPSLGRRGNSRDTFPLELRMKFSCTAVQRRLPESIHPPLRRTANAPAIATVDVNLKRRLAIVVRL